MASLQRLPLIWTAESFTLFGTAIPLRVPDYTIYMEGFKITRQNLLRSKKARDGVHVPMCTATQVTRMYWVSHQEQHRKLCNFA